MNRLGTIAVTLAGGVAAVAAVGWAGLQVAPRSFALPIAEPEDLGAVETPAGLPTPVQRYLRVAMGNEAPRIESLVACGRARANFGIWLPLRFRLIHRSGHAFERYMEVTWFGMPVLKAVDRFVGGVGMTGPVGKAATGPAIDQAANMILWAEAPLMPSLWISDSRIRWEAIDETSARLFFPFEDGQDSMTVQFDAESGLVKRITALRFREEESGKVPWHVDFLSWYTVDGMQLPDQIAVTWEDQGNPWSYWEFDELRWNVDVSETLPAEKMAAK